MKFTRVHVTVFRIGLDQRALVDSLLCSFALFTVCVFSRLSLFSFIGSSIFVPAAMTQEAPRTTGLTPLVQEEKKARFKHVCIAICPHAPLPTSTFLTVFYFRVGHVSYYASWYLGGRSYATLSHRLKPNTQPRSLIRAFFSFVKSMLLSSHRKWWAQLVFEQ